MQRRRDRIILAFDIDNFYVASERLRNPSLVGKPVAIQQKTITATCSYEAREKGVRKLCLIGDAKRMCPDLIVINGEILTYYRRDSRRIWRLVASIVGQAPEKLGMDELFLDVTTLIDNHLANAADVEARYFRLPKSSEVSGFHYTPGVAGVPMPTEADLQTVENQRYIVASHLSAHIRSRIAQEIGFTTSGGVAYNKLLAKLLASENKPSKQTIWLPPTDAMAKSAAADNYMAGLPVKKYGLLRLVICSSLMTQSINGFGHRITQALRSHLLGEPIEEDTYWIEARDQTMDDEKWEPDNVRIDENPLLVKQVRESASPAKFEKWFGERLGSRLWGMLFGIDEEPVIGSPEFPKQISVEDSYLRAKLPTVALALQKISTLSMSLLTRLESELVDEPAALAKSAAPNGARTWVRHPTQMRLTLRGGPGAGSKTLPMPLDTLDLDGLPINVRADKLAQAFHVMFRKMIGSTSLAHDHDKVSLHVINVAVVAFEANAPTPSVRNLLGRPRSPQKPLTAHAWIDSSEQDDEDQEQCSICDQWLPVFAMPAHLTYHIEEG